VAEATSKSLMPIGTTGEFDIIQYVEKIRDHGQIIALTAILEYVIGKSLKPVLIHRCKLATVLAAMLRTQEDGPEC
jgi:hypothetical protein